MTDWSEKIAAELRKRRKTKTTDNAISLEEQRIRTEQTPALWKAFKEAVIKNCNDLNATMKENILVCEVTPANEISIRAHIEDRTFFLKAHLNPEWGLLFQSDGPGGNGQSDTQVYQGKLQFSEGGLPLSPDSLAGIMLHTLFE